MPLSRIATRNSPYPLALIRARTDACENDQALLIAPGRRYLMASPLAETPLRQSALVECVLRDESLCAASILKR
jgi:hypothetical protein